MHRLVIKLRKQTTIKCSINYKFPWIQATKQQQQQLHTHSLVYFNHVSKVSILKSMKNRLSYSTSIDYKDYKRVYLDNEYYSKTNQSKDTHTRCTNFHWVQYNIDGLGASISTTGQAIRFH